jgi:hypothetical protein
LACGVPDIELNWAQVLRFSQSLISVVRLVLSICLPW